MKKKMCKGLLAQPWTLKNKDMVRKLITTQPNLFDAILQDQLEEWTLEVWRKVYSFPKGSAGMASRGNKYMDLKFTHVVDPKDGFLIGDCRNT